MKNLTIHFSRGVRVIMPQVIGLYLQKKYPGERNIASEHDIPREYRTMKRAADP